MPTAARLVGTICFLALALLLTSMMRPLFPGGVTPHFFLQINLLAAVIAGWFTLGSRAGQGYSAAITSGITALAVYLFWMFLIQASYEMVDEAFRKLYDGPVEAVVGIFQNMIEFGQRVLVRETMIAMALGALIAGVVTEFVGRRAS